MTSTEFKELRITKKLTQPQIARLMGVTQGTISNYETGGVIPESKLPLINFIFEKTDAPIADFNLKTYILKVIEEQQHEKIASLEKEISDLWHQVRILAKPRYKKPAKSSVSKKRKSS